MFLAILTHHKKNRILGCNYKRLGHVVSKHFHRMLNDIMKLANLLLVDFVPIRERLFRDLR